MREAPGPFVESPSGALVHAAAAEVRRSAAAAGLQSDTVTAVEDETAAVGDLTAVRARLLARARNAGRRAALAVHARHASRARAVVDRAATVRDRSARRANRVRAERRDFSSMVPEPSEGSALTTNPVYSKLFIELGCGSLVVGVVLVLLTPFLRKLITDGAPAAAPEAPIAEEAATA
jgi:hypothetical protein